LAITLQIFITWKPLQETANTNPIIIDKREKEFVRYIIKIRSKQIKISRIGTRNGKGKKEQQNIKRGRSNNM